MAKSKYLEAAEAIQALQLVEIKKAAKVMRDAAEAMAKIKEDTAEPEPRSVGKVSIDDAYQAANAHATALEALADRMSAEPGEAASGQPIHPAAVLVP